MSRLEQAFAQARQNYPQPWIEYTTTELEFSDDGTLEDVMHECSWRLVNAAAASNGLHPKNKLVLQQWYPKCRVPTNHWRFMISMSEIEIFTQATI